MNSTSSEPFSSYEKAFARLEEILSKMNEGKLSLEQSIAHFEEADKLIAYCQKYLTQAEEKVQILIKTREGTLKLGADQKPELKEFATKESIQKVPF